MAQIKFLPLVLILCILIGCLDTGASARQGNGDFIVFLTSSKKCFASGETLHFKATVTNRSLQTKIIELENRPVLDMIVGNVDNNGKRWSDGKPLTPDLTRLEFGPGSSKTIEMDWVPTETTTVVAWFVSDASRPEISILAPVLILLANSRGLVVIFGSSLSRRTTHEHPASPTQ